MIDVIHVLISILKTCFNGCCKISNSLVQFASMKMTIMLGWYFFRQSKNILFLCINQQFSNQIIIWCCDKSNCSYVNYWQKNLWINPFVISKVDQWFLVKVKSHSLLMQLFFLWLLKGDDLICVVLINTSWRGDNNPFIDDEIMSVICFLSSIFNTLMCLVPLFSHVHSFIIGTRCTIIYSLLTIKIIIMLLFFTK